MDNRRFRKYGAAIGLLAATLLAAEIAHTQSAPLTAVVSRDGKRALVSRRIGDERWAITRNFSDQTVTGNVFRTDGVPPQFVWCESLEVNAAFVERFSCWGADACLASPCNETSWSFLSEVSLDARFFDGARVDWERLGDPVTLPRSFFEPPRGDGGTRDSGVQITFDGLRNLISKDVGEDRWSISLNPDDGTVTGNVFPTGAGRDPSFLWCEEVEGTRTDTTLQCYLAAQASTGRLGPIEDAEDRFFVDGLNGDDESLGTRAFPLQTVQAGIEAARAIGGGEVYVAGGLYEETVELRSRVHVYGGYNPSTLLDDGETSRVQGARTDVWTRDVANFPSTIEAPQQFFCCDPEDHACCDSDGDNNPSGPIGVLGYEIALATFDGFDVRVPDDVEGGDSSIGINLADALFVRIANNTIRSGHGLDGRDAILTQPASPNGNDGLPGTDAGVCPPDRVGGAGGVEMRPATAGGRGGTGGAAVGFAGEAGPDSSSTDVPRGGAGGAGGGVGAPGGSGRSGIAGSTGRNGSAGSAFGRLSDSTTNLPLYRPSNGTSGGSGGPGSGGGGGGGGGGALVFACGGGGGGGGGGGLGGGSGLSGQGGSASLGIVVTAGSDVELIDNRILTGDGGNGGAGGMGGQGGTGGDGGAGGRSDGAALPAGGPGGKGGDGGAGGNGGSGGGGPSIGILESPTSITVRSGNTFVLGNGGLGGPGLLPGEEGEVAEYKKLTEDERR